MISGTVMVYRGWLGLVSNGEEDDILGLLESPQEPWYHDKVAEFIQDDIARYGNYLTVRYFTGSEALSEEEMVVELLRTIAGVGDVQYRVCYTEITGYLWTDEDLIVGGHDLLAELKAHVGRFLHLEVEYSEEGAEHDGNATA